MGNRHERKAEKKRMMKNLTSLPAKGWKKAIAAKRFTGAKKK